MTEEEFTQKWLNLHADISMRCFMKVDEQIESLKKDVGALNSKFQVIMDLIIKLTSVKDNNNA